MSISAQALGEAAVAAQAAAQPVAVRKPPGRRQITAKADSSEAPEPR